MSKGDQPVYPTSNPELLQHAGVNSMEGGLTKREYFAAMAMQGLLAFSMEGNEPTIQAIEYNAKIAVKAADELLKQLEKARE